MLQESKNGVDFDDVERARKVDGEAAGDPALGHSRAGRRGRQQGSSDELPRDGAPVDAGGRDRRARRAACSDDPSGSGKERIAAALQAVAQDPLFVALLRKTQARRDEAYTDKGAKKTAKGSVFKVAADRVNQRTRRNCRRSTIRASKSSSRAVVRAVTGGIGSQIASNVLGEMGRIRVVCSARQTLESCHYRVL